MGGRGSRLLVLEKRGLCDGVKGSCAGLSGKLDWHFQDVTICGGGKKSQMYRQIYQDMILCGISAVAFQEELSSGCIKALLKLQDSTPKRIFR